MPAKALRIRHTGERELLRLAVSPADLPVEQAQLLLQRRVAVSRQGLNQICEQRAQPPRDLQIMAAASTYFAERQMHEIFPIRRPEDHSKLAGSIHDFIGPKVPLAHRPKHSMQLIDGEHAG